MLASPVEIAVIVAHVNGTVPDETAFRIAVDPDPAGAPRDPLGDIVLEPAADVIVIESPAADLPELRGIELAESQRVGPSRAANHGTRM